MEKEQIIYRKVDELVPYEENPRFNDDAVEYVARSIEEFGFKVPIVIDGSDVIVAGHTRLKAAKELGMIEVPTIVADDLTEEQINAFRLADNKTNELSEWDFERLRVEIEQIEGIDMSDFGFDEMLPDIELDDVFEDFYDEEQEEDIGEVLKWTDKRVFVNEDDIEYLDNKYHQYVSEDIEVTFVEWLRSI